MGQLFIIHLIVSIIGLIVSLIVARSVQAGLITFICIFMFPIGGLLSIIVYFIYKLRHKETGVDENDLMVVGESNYKFYNNLIVEDEINVLPLNDVLSVSENSIKRERFLETIKKDVRGYSRYMKLALSNEDGETSHYAAAIIQETKRKMDVQVYELMGYVSKAPDDIDALTAYADFLITYLALDLFQVTEKEKFSYEYVNAANKIIRENKDEKYIIYLINVLLEYKDYKKAIAAGDFYLYNYTETVDVYLMNMKIYYSIRDMDSLERMLNALRSSDLVYDNETLNRVRFWIGD